MHASLLGHRPAIALACRRHAVDSLELFGSATGPAFEPGRSDVDFIVSFGPEARPDLFAHYFGLKQDLEALLGSPVDLVMAGALRDPHVLRSAAAQRELLYASAQPEVA
jgi:predicted nucleotidyltransferase